MNKPSSEYCILGYSSAAVAMVLESLEQLGTQGEPITVVENQTNKDTLPTHSQSLSAKRVWHEEWYRESGLHPKVQFLMGVYRPGPKRQVFEFFDTRYMIDTSRYASLIHPTATLSSTTDVQPGTQIGPGVNVAAHTVLGTFATINRGVNIGHHVQVDSFATINPGVNIGGHCRIGEAVTLGMGCNILQEIDIGAGSVVAAGAVVTKDVAPMTTVMGVPARPK